MNKKDWIKVTDRLPDHERTVLIYGTNCGYAFSYYSIYAHKWIAYDDSIRLDVTHWMELEKPE